jgi:prophage regulatory protein
MTEKLLRLAAVVEITGMSRSSIYAAMANGNFPKSVTIGARSVAWPSSVIAAWVKCKIDGKQYKPKKPSIWDLPSKTKDDFLDSSEI